MNCAQCNMPVPENSRFCLSCGADLSDPGGGPRTTGGVPQLTARLTRALEGRYQLDKMVGRGGMGAVFLAEDLTLERPVAIKVLPPEVSHDESLIGRFEREARTAAKLDHPNIIPIFAVESAEGLHYFVMKYVSGESLDDVLDRGALEIDTCKRILWEAARALGHAHKRGVVHRDIKPANIMLDHDGRVMLADFGISKAMQAATQFTGTGQVIGTPHYMSPEQSKGTNVDGRSDQYSLGVVGYQAITGRLPFSDDSVHTVIYKHIFEDPPEVHEFRPDAPPNLATAIHRALRKEPDERFGSMEDFAAAVWPEHQLSVSSGSIDSRAGFDPVMASAPTQITPTTAPTIVGPPGQRSGRGSKLAAAIGIPLLLGAGGVGAWAWSNGMLGSRASSDGDPKTQSPTAGLIEDSTATASRPDSAATGQRDSVVVADPEPPPTVVVTTPPPQRQPQQQPTTSTTTRASRPPSRRQQQPAQPQRPRFGFLSVQATPFGTVWVDGIEIRETPLLNHQLLPGQHTVRITRDGCREIVDTVTVTAGRTSRLTKTLVCGGP